MTTETTTALPAAAHSAGPPIELLVFALSMVSVLALVLAPHRLGLF